MNEPADLTVVLAHEMGHALGILPNTNTTNGTIKFGQLSVWNKDIKADDINGNPISADSGKTIIVNDTSAVNGFNISILSEIDKIIYDSENKAPFAPYFAGTNTLNVLKGGRDDATFKHYQYEYSGLRVKGLPINGVEKNANGNLIAELSHIELRNSYMSHQNYRNWSTFMEAELAVLKDLGYDIELSEHYGKSYYTNENNVTNSNVFTTNKPFGIGLHIYGDNNTITQTGAITSSGIASVGARVEGVENKLTINSDINMSGANSVGILASYGKDHEITINNGTSISATGENGIAASFNFGKNMLGEYIEHRGSYLRAIMGKDIELDDDTAGPLVKSFTVNGKLEGQKAAIYIDDTAYVQQININNSAQIEGAILSNWNSRTSGKYAHVQNIDQSYIDGLLLTELNFNNYNKTLYKDIIGDTFIMNLNNSSLTNNATTRVYNLNIDTNSTLEGTANYIIKNNFTNKGAYNGTANGAGISANKIINTGEIGIKGEFNLDAPITGNGTLKIGFGALSIPTIVNFSNSVDKIENKITINENPTLNFANNSATDIEVGKMTFNSDATMSIDVDIATQVADRFNFKNSSDLVMNDKTLTIDKVKVVPNFERATPTQANFDIPLVSEDLNNQNLNIDFSDDAVASLPTETLTTAIFKYNMSYDNDNYRFLFNAPFGGGNDNYKNFNPSVLASSNAAQVGSFLNQVNSFEQAFSSLDSIMSLPSKARQALKLANRYASADGNSIFNPNQLPEYSKGVWFKPYTTFENVSLNNGPKVSNVAYGSYFGGDTGILDGKKGWDLLYSAYVGYNGSHQTYDSVGVYQNGGQIGASAFAYKNNFWTGLTANVGSNVAQASTMYGNENFTMLTSGIASKTGYNFEFKEGKVILQPNFLMSYSFVHTFEYDNAAGVNITSDPLNAIQIAPELKLIGNIKSWQPYLGVQMVWNIIDKTHFRAANVSLPSSSIDPYVQYGIGLQKRWGDRFSGFGQAMIRNGGRTGIALSAGFRWTLGK